MRSWSWVLLILLTIAIKWISLYPDWVERNYTYGIYPVISRVQRFLFGWIPFSLGDLLYGLLAVGIIYKTVQFIRLLILRRVTRQYFIRGLQTLLFTFLAVYVSFNLLWGLNYNRRGIAYQLQLDVKPYTTEDLDTLCYALQSKLNFYADRIDTTTREEFLGKTGNLFNVAREAYNAADDKYLFLVYHPGSIKASMVGFLGRYVGFQGYYNPFTGEGQLKRSVPIFVQPFVACHEIAHQLGYAKENEANFVGFLAAKESPSNDFIYSAYYDMYQYAMMEMLMLDSKRYANLNSTLHKIARRDKREYARYIFKMENPIAPIMLKVYDGYLRMNNQPKGYRTYNEVVTWLVAYYKKYGVEKL